MKSTVNKSLNRMAIVLILAVVLLLSSCFTESKLVGEYKGTAGSYLKLNQDGTCYYGEDDDTGAGQGTWYIEDGVLYIEVNNLNYVVYASIEDSDDGFLLKSKSSRWNAEYFSKIDK